MRYALLLLLIAWIAPAQTPAGAALTGTVLERDSQTASGQFSVRAATNQVFRYRFDSKTTVDRDSRAIDVARLNPGDRVEVISDQPPGAALRYAVSVRVLAASSPPRAEAGSQPRTSASIADREAPAGSLSFTGIVALVSTGRLTLRLRDGRQQAILLRKDTSYIADGKRVDGADLKLSMRVFVEGGRSIVNANEVEAYRVVWGNIMQPD